MKMASPTSRGSQRQELVSRRAERHWPGVAALDVRHHRVILMELDPEESEHEQVIRKMFETHESGAFRHPVLGHVDPWGFGWACQFTDTTTLRIPVHVKFCAGNPVSQHDEDNYFQIRARFPALLRAWHTDYRKLRAADEIYGGPAEVLDLEIHLIHGIIGPKTVWRIAATARPYDGDWEFKMLGWKFIETVGGIG